MRHLKANNFFAKTNNSCVGKAYSFCLSHAPGVKIWRTLRAATMPAPSDCMKSTAFGSCVHSHVFFKINGEYIDFDRMNLMNTMGDQGEEKMR